MKSILKKVAGIAIMATLVLGIVSCANETETKIEYVEKTYCAPVTFSSEDLGDDGVKVTMATTTEGAVIHYTTDGTAPAAESTAYTAPVTFTADAIIKAIAVKSGIENSPVSVAAVSIVEKTVEVDKPVEVTKYVCPKCKSEYTTAEEAANCCGVQYETVKKYVCPRDGKEYDTADEAENCCGPIEIEKPVEVEKLVYTSELAAGTYTVYHFQQKTTGGKAVSDYVLEATENSKSVAAKSTIANLKKTYEGFAEKAMAQNETAIYVFYDRNTITYTFQTGTEGKFEDGTTSKEVSGLYGASYTKPRTPTSGDYNFVKWQDSSETAEPSTFGAEDKTWTAVWRAKSEGGETIPEGFVKVAGVTITGSETWTPSSSVFVSGRALTIPTLIVCDHEVTRGEFKTIMGTDPSTASAYDKDGNQLTGDAVLNNPVNYVNWYAAIAYCNKKSIAENLTPCYSVSGVTDWANLAYSSIPTSSNTAWDAATCNFDADGYRLPTDAEWEWLARGGENYTYAGSNTVNEVAWYTSNTNDTGSREVKTKKENGYGLYDMSGNVCEWCWDWYGRISSSSSATGAASGSYRVQRGGSWYDDDLSCRVAFRYNFINPDHRSNNFGFRVVRSSSN